MAEASGSSSNPGAVPWATQTVAPTERVTARVRQLVENLPDWDPLPPGELIVRRPGHT